MPRKTKKVTASFGMFTPFLVHDNITNKPTIKAILEADEVPISNMKKFQYTRGAK